MAINAWWEGLPEERYWIEVTDRESLGSNLIAPKLASNGKETPSYTLVSYVQPGDVVLHWWKRPGEEPAIVGSSTVVGDPESSRLTWQAHGTVGRSQPGPKTSPAWEAPLADFEELDEPITLADLRELEPELRRIRDELTAQTNGAIYFPYAFSDKRPLRTTQGYLLKFPTAVVDLIPALSTVRASTPLPPPGDDRPPRRGTRRLGRQSNPIVRKAVERHAVDWALAHFSEIGYLVEDVGDTESFDIFAVGPMNDELHIEVKGSTTESIAIELTDGEVKHWGPEYERVLMVVDRIICEIDSEGTVITAGGRARVWRNWDIDTDALEPTRYRYTLPGDD